MNEDLSAWLTTSIQSFAASSPDNSLGKPFDEKAWETPLVGFSSSNDPYYALFKEDIGSFYFTPQEFFVKSFPDIAAHPQQLTVISWILPQTMATKLSQRADAVYPCERAVHARTSGDEFNKKLGAYVVRLLEDQGFKALCPMLSPYWRNEKSEKYGYASNWSERHAAFVSGLGTFGLSDALITPLGMAMRCGSVITNAKLSPTIRPYQTHTEYCLHYRTGGCMACARRCPAGAITENGHDKDKCQEYRKNIASVHTKEEFHSSAVYCGLCQFGVPCESKIP